MLLIAELVQVSCLHVLTSALTHTHLHTCTTHTTHTCVHTTSPTVDLNQLLMRYKDEEQRQLAKQEEEDEALVQSVFNRDQIHRLNDDEEEEEEGSGGTAASTNTAGSKRAPTDILGQTSARLLSYTAKFF